MNQPGNFVSKPSNSDPNTVEALENFLNILTEVVGIDFSEKSPHDSLSSQQDGESLSEISDDGQAQEIQPQLSETLTETVASAEQNYDINDFSDSTRVRGTTWMKQHPEQSEQDASQVTENGQSPQLSQVQPPSIIFEKQAEASEDGLERLQSILLGSKVSDLHQLMDMQKARLENLEQQLCQPQALIKLLLPLREELLNPKIQQLKEDILQAIIADIQKTTQEQVQLSFQSELSELHQLITHQEQKLVALEQRIYEPNELINHLLPLMGELIEKTVHQAKESITHSLVPIIDEVIDNKTRLDRVSIGEAIAPAIPVAITQQINDSPTEIAIALGPEIAVAIKEQIRIEQDAMVDALYPIIGSTIAKQIAETINQINDKIENTLSPETIQRKIRAKIQGVSEAELLLKEETPFTIRAVFLIHKASGLVISEIQHFGSERLESEMVAGMLTAIRSFVNDCIAQSGSIAEINEIEYGDSKIILEVAGYCYMAVVVQGIPPNWLILRMRSTLGTIVQNYSKPIELYNGDPATIPEPINRFLEAFRENCAKYRQAKSREEKASKPSPLLVGGLVLLGLIGIPWGFFQYRSWVERQIETQTAEALFSDPELSVYRLSTDADGKRLRLFGRVPNQLLRTKAEQIVKTTAPTFQLDNQIIAVKVPPDPVLTAAEVQRVTSLLNQMNGVAIVSQYAAGKLTVEGTAQEVADAKKITQAFENIPGVESVTSTVGTQTHPINIRIYFRSASAAIEPTDVSGKINLIRNFLNRYPENHLKIIGHSTLNSNPPENWQLALERAETVRDILIQQGIAPNRLTLEGTTQSPSDVAANQPQWLSRCVEFKPFTPVLKNQQ